MKSLKIISVRPNEFASLHDADRADIIFQRLPMGCVKVVKSRSGPLGVMSERVLMDEINRMIFSGEEESK